MATLEPKSLIYELGPSGVVPDRDGKEDLEEYQRMPSASFIRSWLLAARLFRGMEDTQTLNLLRHLPSNPGRCSCDSFRNSKSVQEAL